MEPGPGSTHSEWPQKLIKSCRLYIAPHRSGRPPTTVQPWTRLGLFFGDIASTIVILQPILTGLKRTTFSGAAS